MKYKYFCVTYIFLSLLIKVPLKVFTNKNFPSLIALRSEISRCFHFKKVPSWSKNSLWNKYLVDIWRRGVSVYEGGVIFVIISIVSDYRQSFVAWSNPTLSGSTLHIIINVVTLATSQTSRALSRAAESNDFSRTPTMLFVAVVFASYIVVTAVVDRCASQYVAIRVRRVNPTELRFVRTRRIRLATSSGNKSRLDTNASRMNHIPRVFLSKTSFWIKNLFCLIRYNTNSLK